MRAKAIALLVCCLLVDSCKHSSRRGRDSELKDFPPIPQLTEQDALLRFFKKSQFDDNARVMIEQGDLNLAKARDIITEYSKNLAAGASMPETSDLMDCLRQSQGEDGVECEGKAGIPNLAIPYLKRAYDAYMVVVSSFDPPILAPEATDRQMVLNPSVVRSEKDFPNKMYVYRNTSINEKGEPVVPFWDSMLEKSCGALLTPIVRDLCEDVFLYYTLQSSAFKVLEKSLNANPVEAEAQYVYFSQLYEASEQVYNRFTNVHSEASMKLAALQQGIYDPNQVESVPLLAVVSTPKTLLPLLKRYLDNFKTNSDALSVIRDAVTLGKIDAIRNADGANEVAQQIYANGVQQAVINLEKNYWETESAYIREKSKKMTERLRDASTQVAYDFNAVFGTWNAVSAVGMPQTVQVSPASEGEVITLPTGLTKGVIEINANPSTRIRANGLYYNKIKPPFETGCCRVKVKMPSPPRISCCERIKSAVGDAVSNPLSADSRAKMAAKLSDKKFVSENFFRLGFGSLSPIALTPVGGQLVKNLGAKALNWLGDRLTPPSRDGGPQLPREIDPNPPKPIYPEIQMDIWDQLTDLNGYVMTASISRSVGTSQSKTVSNSRGSSSGFSYFASVSNSDGKSWGTTDGTSESTGRSVNTMQGFFHHAASAPAYRVGMLMARLMDCKDANQQTIDYPVGISNIITIDNTTLGCTKLKLFINDDADGGATKLCRKKEGNSIINNYPCSSSEKAPIKISFYIDNNQQFDKLVSIVNSQSFKDALSSSLNSPDVAGSAWRFFLAAALKEGLTDEAIARFKPVVESLIAEKVAIKEIDRMAIDVQKTDLEAIRYLNQASILEVQTRLLETKRLNFANIEVLQDALRNMREQRIRMHADLADFYGQRLSYWYGMMRSSLAYHAPGMSLPNVAKAVENMRAQVMQGLMDEAPITVSKPSDLALFEKQLVTLEEKDYVEQVVTQSKIGHCLVDLKDLIPALPVSADGEARPSAPLSYYMAPFDTAGADIRPIREAEDPDMYRALPTFQVVSDDNPLFDRNVGQFLKRSNTDAVKRYLRIQFKTNPSLFMSYRAKIDDAMRKQLGTHQLPFRCGGENPRGLEKIIGVAVSYSSNVSDSRNVAYIEHDPLMFGYAANGRAPIYRYLDKSMPPSFWGGSIDALQGSITSVSMRPKSDLDACFSISGDADAANEECAKKVLGTAIDNQTILTNSLARSFFNSLMGGTWNVYVSLNNENHEFRSSLMNFNLHFFFKQVSAVNQ